MSKKTMETAENLLKMAVHNAGCIESILMEISEHIPEEDRSVTDELFVDLQKRMFYQDTLYDAHGVASAGGKLEATEVLFNYELFDITMRGSGLW